ncbi:MAG TPA: EpsI family protein, partial [Paracoccaceae bacterium]|nr:EpsI family protein [Paracoccaceae bacterium]
ALPLPERGRVDDHPRGAAALDQLPPREPDPALRVRHDREGGGARAAGGLVSGGLAAAWAAVPERPPVTVTRDPFALFPAQLGDWQAGPHRMLEPDVERILAADDYHSVLLARAGGAPVDLFLAWYRDDLQGGVHSPEVCLPGGGWEIAELRRIEAQHPVEGAFSLNRAVIQKGTERMLVYYWFEQQGRRTASGLTAKLQLLAGKLTNGRSDSALVRLIVPIGAGGAAEAEARLQQAMAEVLRPLPRFVPGL